MNTQAYGEVPTMLASTYGSATNAVTMIGGDAPSDTGWSTFGGSVIDPHEQIRALRQFRPPQFGIGPAGPQPQPERPMAQKRIVRVYLADTDDSLPMDRSLLYQGAEKFTDLNDQELYFEIPVKEILEMHNEYRKTVVNKKATQTLGKEVMLEPIRIRDLKMLVVTIASFA